MQINTKIKRGIYIYLAVILGILLGIIAYALIEKAYINDLLSQGLMPYNFGEGFFLPPGIVLSFFIGGAILGYILGVRWWQIVYVEKRHWRFKK